MPTLGPPPEPPAGLLPLFATATMAGGVGLLFLLSGSESALLLLFMVGLIYPLALAFLAPSVLVVLHAVRTRARPLLVASAALAVLTGLWTHVLMKGIASHDEPAVTALWASSLAYAILAFWLGAGVFRTANIPPA